MAVNLTQGAIVMMCFTTEELHPVLQVIDLKLVQSQQNSATERYRLVLSDGLHYQQGMLATQKNELVHSGRLQKGSIVKLSQFICNDVQNRKIIIIVDLDVILDKCDLIGDPNPAPKEAPSQSAVSHAGNGRSAADQLGSTAGNSQYLNRPAPVNGFYGEQNTSFCNPQSYSLTSHHSQICDREKTVMAVNLTQGAIITMCFTSEVLEPVLQVFDLKLVQSQQNSTTERYRLVLSDGLYYQQGMLATQKNELVHSGRLQKGSVVKLTQFICNDVQNRKIIIIVELDVIFDKWDLIGKPVPAPKEAPAQSDVSHAGDVQSAAGQLGSTAENSQYLNGGSYAAGINDRPNVAVPSMDRPTVNPSASSVYSNTSGSARYSTSDGANLNRPVPVNGSYVRPPQPMYQQPSPMYTNRGPTGRNDAPPAPSIIPISALNPYQNMWTIKARITAKRELRVYNNARGEGKVFSFDLLDSDGGEIRATCFNAVADQFYDVTEVGKVYLVSRGYVKPAQKNINHLPNDQEITLDITSVIQPCLDDDNSIPQQIYNFRPIGDIESMESNSIVDVIAVVTAISPTTSIMRKNGTETQKRSLQLKDMSGRSVELTLWGSFCNTEGQKLQNICDSGAFPILVVKSARVNDFNGKSIGTIATSQLLVEPDFPEAFTLREWFDQEGRNVPRQSIFRESSSFGKSEVWKTISQIKDEKLGTSEKPSWISICASVSFVKVDNFCYTACPIVIGDRKCNKKVTINGDGKWRCVRCDKSVDACDYRYLLQMQIHDHTGMTWVTAFQEGGEIIMGMPAKDLHFLKFEEQDEEKFAEIIRKVLFTKYVFKLKVKEETFNDEARVKSTVLKAEKVVNFASESKSLLDLIDKLQSENAEDAPINSAINTTGQATPPVYNPTNSNTNTGRDLLHQVSQYGNQHSSSFASSGAPGSYISCSNCGGSDHSSAQCLHLRNPPEQSAGGAYVNTVSGGSGCASGNCYKCQQPGHWANNCPNMRAAPQSHGNSNAGQGRYGNSQNQSAGEAYANKVSGGSGGASGNCYRWQHIGHWARDCPARVNDFNGKSVGTKFDKVDNFCNTNMLIGIIGGFGFGILLLSTFLCFC